LCRNSDVKKTKEVSIIEQLRNDIGTVEDAVTTYTKDVERLARGLIKMRMNYKWLKEDLEQQGYIGLIEAYNNYDSTKTKGHFWNYASKFVKGRMVDFTSNYCNPIKPSKKINTLMLQIKKMNLFDYSMEHIAEKLGCSTGMAGQVVDFMAIRKTNSLDHSTKETNDTIDKHHINVIRANLNEDDYFRVDILNGASQIEQKIIQMLIDGYSRVNIMEICEILETELNAIIDKILVICGYDYKTIGNRKEVLLMENKKLAKELDEYKKAVIRKREEIDGSIDV
jgi:DNA-directed RNA polymerase specialized sigma subunit